MQVEHTFKPVGEGDRGDSDLRFVAEQRHDVSEVDIYRLIVCARISMTVQCVRLPGSAFIQTSPPTLLIGKRFGFGRRRM